MMKIALRSLPLLVVLVCQFVLAQSPYAIQPVEAAAELPKALVASLNPKGIRLFVTKNGLSTPVCDLWWTKSVASHAVSGKNNSQYAAVETGALVGVLHFIEEGEDSRDQKMQPGFYTLRYAKVAADPEHSDNGGPQDALLATPLWADKHEDQVMKLEELLRVSQLSSKTKKPVVINLMPINPAYTDSPSLISDDQGDCAIQVNLQGRRPAPAKPTDIQLSILLVTPVREDGES